jgi:hypothetical protein
MPEDQTPQSTATEPAGEPANWPAPPPYRPDTDLIGYIEEGQKPLRRRLGHPRRSETKRLIAKFRS